MLIDSTCDTERDRKRPEPVLTLRCLHISVGHAAPHSITISGQGVTRIEGGYSDLGKSKFHSIVTSGGSGTGDGEWRAYSIDISALGILPLGDQFSLFGRAGLGIWNLDFKFTASGPGGTATVSESESGVSPLLGIGATFNFTPQFSLRGEIERHFSVGKDDTTGKSDIDLITLGLQFRF